MHELPIRLVQLIKSYEGRTQKPVPYYPSTWKTAVNPARPGSTSLLSDDGVTSAEGSHRTVSRASLVTTCQAMDFDDPDSVARTFVLVMAWGTGITGSRGVRNTRLALEDGMPTITCLAESARALRGVGSLDDPVLAETYRSWCVPGVGQSFFSKWFTFAGRPVTAGRPWNPLILDQRVYRTLNSTLTVSTRDLANSRLRSHRYWSYVAALHDWATQLQLAGYDVDADRLEWILFAQNGSES